MKHKRKSRSFGLFAGSSLLILLVVVGALLLFQQTITLGEAVFLPDWGSIYCNECPEKTINNSMLVTARYKDKPNTYFCGAETMMGYFPKGCDYTIKVLDSRIFDKVAYKVCDLNDTSCGDARTTTIFRDTSFWIVGTRTTNIHITDNEYIGVRFDQLDPFGLFDVGDIVVSTVSDGYCLFDQQRGFQKIVDTCDTRALSGGYLVGDKTAVDAMNGTVLPPGHVVNWVLGVKPEYQTNGLLVRNGEKVYVNEPYKYYLVKRSTDGYLYADTSNPIIDKSIQCVPSSPYCSDDGTVVVNNPSGKKCNEASGTVVNYIPLGDGYAQPFTCINGELVATGEKKLIEVCPTGYSWREEFGECRAIVIGKDLPTTKTDLDKFLSWLVNNIAYVLGIGVALILILFLFKSGGQGNSGGQQSHQPQPIIITK